MSSKRTHLLRAYSVDRFDLVTQIEVTPGTATTQDITNLLDAVSGKIEFMGVPIDNLPHAALIKLCKHLAAKELDRRTEAFCDARNYA